MLLLPRLISRSSRSLAAMIGCAQAARGRGDWPAGIPGDWASIPPVCNILAVPLPCPCRAPPFHPRRFLAVLKEFLWIVVHF
jgi:hypothetical protein